MPGARRRAAMPGARPDLPRHRGDLGLFQLRFARVEEGLAHETLARSGLLRALPWSCGQAVVCLCPPLELILS